MEDNSILKKLKSAPRGITETLGDVKSKRMGGAKTNYIPSADEVAALINSIPKGQTKTINELRSELAKAHRTDTACPAKILKYWKWMANLPDDLKLRDNQYNISWWRVLKDGKPSRHMPGGIDHQKKILSNEGILIE